MMRSLSSEVEEIGSSSSSSNSFFGTTAASDPTTPLNEIVIRTWQLNENSTHYDRLVAAPSDEDLIKFWVGWAIIMLSTALLCTWIWIPLLYSRQIQKNPFNYYLIFLLTPDMLVAWICGLTCLNNAITGYFTSVAMCQFQSFYMIASICANSWLNAVVAFQLYKMLSSAHRFARYQPPTHQQVTYQALGVYAYSSFVGFWATIGYDWWPHKTRLTIGAACIPMDYSPQSTAFFYVFFLPMLFGIPFCYVCYAGYQIYKHQMLPPSGRRRILAIYFFRLAAVFLIMWVPGLLMFFVTGAWLDPWVEWVGGSWSHLQGAVSALVSLLKPDIWKAVKDFWTCKCKQHNLPPPPHLDSSNMGGTGGTATGERRRRLTQQSNSAVSNDSSLNFSVQRQPQSRRRSQQGGGVRGTTGRIGLRRLSSSWYTRWSVRGESTSSIGRSSLTFHNRSKANLTATTGPPLTTSGSGHFQLQQNNNNVNSEVVGSPRNSVTNITLLRNSLTTTTTSPPRNSSSILRVPLPLVTIPADFSESEEEEPTNNNNNDNSNDDDDNNNNDDDDDIEDLNTSSLFCGIIMGSGTEIDDDGNESAIILGRQAGHKKIAEVMNLCILLTVGYCYSDYG